MDNIFIVTGTVLDFAPFMILGLMPFWDSIKNKKNVCFYVILVMIFSCASSLLFGSMDEWELLFWLWYSVALVLCLFIYFYAIKMQKTKSLFILFVLTAYANSLANVTYFLERTFYPEEYVLSYYPSSYTFILLPVLIVTMPFVWLFIKRVIKPAILNYETPAWKYMWLIPCFLTVVNALFGELYSMGYSGTWQYLLAMILLAAASFLIYFVSIKMIIQTDRNARFELQLKQQGELYEVLRTNIADAKHARHDLRHHLSVIQSYTAAGENDKLSEYLSNYIESLPDKTELAFCENFAVNSVLQYYIGIAKDENIQVDVSLEIPAKINISDTDLCIIFGNCVENAIEACQKVDGERFIKINSKIVGKNLAITIDNSFDGFVDEKDGAFFSRKHDGEGIGIASVKAVAAKYGATARFEVVDNVFQAMIMLRIT